MVDETLEIRLKLIDKLKSSETPVNVTFEKADGSTRVMRCTLNEKFLPARVEPVDGEEPKKRKTPNPDNLAVWDVDANGWRSFNISRVIGVE